MSEINGSFGQMVVATQGSGSKMQLDFLVVMYRICAESEGKSPATISWVTGAVRYIINFLRDNGHSTDIRDIGVGHIRAFSLHLRHRRRFANHPYTRPQDGLLSGHSVNGYLRALRAFWTWAEAEGFIDCNPFLRIKISPAPKRVIDTMSTYQLASLIEAVDLSTPQGYRDYTIILLLVDTGLRVSELVGLKLHNLNLEKKLLKVMGKGNKERMVPFGARAQRALMHYLNLHRPEPARPLFENLFLTEVGEAMKKRRVQSIVARYGQKAGILGMRCSPHTLRHTAAVMWIRNGGDVFSLQQILGHSTMDMVRIYVNLAQSDIEAAHRKYSPADNLEIKAPRHSRPSRVQDPVQKVFK